jgi:hypothetical protein
MQRLAHTCTRARTQQHRKDPAFPDDGTGRIPPTGGQWNRPSPPPYCREGELAAGPLWAAAVAMSCPGYYGLAGHDHPFTGRAGSDVLPPVSKGSRGSNAMGRRPAQRRRSCTSVGRIRSVRPVGMCLCRMNLCMDRGGGQYIDRGPAAATGGPAPPPPTESRYTGLILPAALTRIRAPIVKRRRCRRRRQRGLEERLGRRLGDLDTAMRQARADTRLGLERLRIVLGSLNRLEARLDEIAAGAAAEGPAAVDGGWAMSRGGAGSGRAGWSGKVEKTKRVGSGDSQVYVVTETPHAHVRACVCVCVRLRACMRERTCELASLRAAGAIRAYNQRKWFRVWPFRPAGGRISAETVGRNAAERAGPRHLPRDAGGAEGGGKAADGRHTKGVWVEVWRWTGCIVSLAVQSEMQRERCIVSLFVESDVGVAA